MFGGFINNDESLGMVYTYDSYAEDRVLRIRIQKRNKKEWKCLFCDNAIPIGSGSAYHSGLSRGRFYEYHVCMSCYGGDKH